MSSRAANRPGHAAVLTMILAAKAMESARQLFVKNLCMKPKIENPNQLDEFEIHEDDRDTGTVILTPLGKIGLTYKMVRVELAVYYEITVVDMCSGDEVQIIRLKDDLTVSMQDQNWHQMAPEPGEKEKELEWRDMRVAILESIFIRR